MPGEEVHRKRVRHFDIAGHVHELTFSCYAQFPLLQEDRCKVLLSKGIDAALSGHRFQLVGFVFMPEHVHLLVYPLAPSCEISGLLYAIKRPVSFRIRRVMEESGDTRLRDLIVQERPGKTAFRFWQEGGGYDRNLTNAKAVLEALEYAHANPVRRGLCEHPGQWKWSSWHHYNRPGWQDADLPAVGGWPRE